MPGKTRRPAKGFSLLELMVALAVVAILALVALPAYSRYLQEGRLVEAPTLLTRYAAVLERRFLETHRYDEDGACTFPAGRHFAVQCELRPGGYRLIARNLAGAGLGASGRYVYALDSEGRRRTLRFAGEVRDLPCWQLRAGVGCP